jgi:hypothetical protein
MARGTAISDLLEQEYQSPEYQSADHETPATSAQPSIDP